MRNLIGNLQIIPTDSEEIFSQLILSFLEILTESVTEDNH